MYTNKEILEQIITDLVDIYEDWSNGVVNAPSRIVGSVVKLEALRDALK
jgi:hypothetical protein